MLLATAIAGGGAGPLVSTSPTSLYSGSKSASRTTASVSTLVSGGVGPFTYAWTILGETHPTVANSPAASTTTFTISAIGPGDSCTATGRVTVTDTGTGLTGFADVSIVHDNLL